MTAMYRGILDAVQMEQRILLTAGTCHNNIGKDIPDRQFLLLYDNEPDDDSDDNDGDHVVTPKEPIYIEEFIYNKITANT